MAGFSDTERQAILARVPLFAGCEGEPLLELARAVRERPLRARQELFHKGDEARDLFLVVSGRLKAITTSPDGNDVAFDVMGPGELIGDIATLAGSARTGTVVAVEACQLLALDHADFVRLAASHPEVARRLFTSLARRVAHLSELLEDTQFLNLPQRLAKKLLELELRFGRRDGEATRIELRLSQEEWGDLVGATREAVNKQIRTWSRDGLVEMEQGRVRILDRERLLAEARGAAC